MDADDLTAALHACAAGLYPLEAGTELLIANGTFLHRDDFTTRFIQHGTSISDGTTPMASIDWDAAITALQAGELPTSGGERRILQLAASLAAGTPVSLRDAVTGLDDGNVARLLAAIRHASGNRSTFTGALSNNPARPTGNWLDLRGIPIHFNHGLGEIDC
jgi:hypothetical protein